MQSISRRSIPYTIRRALKTKTNSPIITEEAYLLKDPLTPRWQMKVKGPITVGKVFSSILPGPLMKMEMTTSSYLGKVWHGEPRLLISIIQERRKW